MKVKRLLAAAITAFVALTSVLPVSAIDYGKEYENKPSGTYDVKFKDVPRNNWAFEYIGEMQKRGIINGYPDGKYYPDNYVERWREFFIKMSNDAFIFRNEEIGRAHV